MNGKGKAKMLIVVLAVLAVLLIGGGIAGAVSWSRLQKEHAEARSLPLNAVDFGNLNDGTYHGDYAGGMYGWRAGTCDVTVADGKVVAIKMVSTKDPGAGNTDQQMLYDRVIASQSLQVDTISGATLTSKGWLQCVENALVQAQHA